MAGSAVGSGGSCLVGVLKLCKRDIESSFSLYPKIQLQCLVIDY